MSLSKTLYPLLIWVKDICVTMDYNRINRDKNGFMIIWLLNIILVLKFIQVHLFTYDINVLSYVLPCTLYRWTERPLYANDH